MSAVARNPLDSNTIGRRILQISNHQDVLNMRTLPGGIVNLSLADPTKLKLFKGLVSSRENNSFVVGTLSGITTLFVNGLDDLREICVKPFFHSWPRFAAVLGSVCNADAVYFRTWQNGVVFGSGIFEPRGSMFGSATRGVDDPPIYGANLSKDQTS